MGEWRAARTLAMGLNCERGESLSSCRFCRACFETYRGINLDVLEIVLKLRTAGDDVDRIAQSLPHRPARDRYKVIAYSGISNVAVYDANCLRGLMLSAPRHARFIEVETGIVTPGARHG